MKSKNSVDNSTGSVGENALREQMGAQLWDNMGIFRTEAKLASLAGTLDEMRSIAARYPQARSALLPMLHLVQSVDGRVSPAGVKACADILGITTAQVSGVATFYTMYRRRPGGTHHVGVCTTALCAVESSVNCSTVSSASANDLGSSSMNSRNRASRLVKFFADWVLCSRSCACSEVMPRRRRNLT